MSTQVRPREIARKRFQAAAAATLDAQAGAIQHLATDLQATREFLAGLSERVDAIRPEIATLHGRVDERDGAARLALDRADMALGVIVTRTFWGRLRWVFTGK